MSNKKLARTVCLGCSQRTGVFPTKMQKASKVSCRGADGQILTRHVILGGGVCHIREECRLQQEDQEAVSAINAVLA